MQEMLFRVAGLPMVENCMSGYNSCVFAYGQVFLLLLLYNVYFSCKFSYLIRFLFKFSQPSVISVLF